jgi:hypothetical protein
VDESATSTATTSSGGLPADLVPNVVEDECLLGPADLGALTGRAVARAENTELADDAGKRSCFYTSSNEEPLGRIDVYAPATTPASQLVTRIAANSTGSRTLTGLGDGAVLVAARDGSFEFVVASRALLIVLTLPPGAVSIPPTDAAWSAAGTAMLARLSS